MIYRHSVAIPSNLQEISNLIESEIRSFSQEVDDEDLLFDFRLILNELLINAGKHGNKWNENKQIYYTLEKDSKYFRIIVEDEGEGLTMPIAYDPKSLKGSGRGLKIVKELSDDFKVESNRIIIQLKQK